MAKNKATGKYEVLFRLRLYLDLMLNILMLNTKQMDLAQKEKKNHLKISRPGDKNYLTTRG